MTKAERLRLWSVEISRYPLPSAPLETLALLNRVLDEIEDQYSGVPKALNPSLIPGDRMYAILPDHVEDFLDGKIARSFRHRIYLWKDGGFDVVNLLGRVYTFGHHGATPPTSEHGPLPGT